MKDNECISYLGNNYLRNGFISELSISFRLAKIEDEAIKVKASGADDSKKKKKANDGNNLLANQSNQRFEVAFNKELSSELSEILQVHNEERRRPKCAKGARDMTPL
jgi:hypothetical protein